MALDPEHVASSTGDALGLEEGLWLPGRGARVSEDLRFQEGSGFGAAIHSSMDPF